MKQLLFLLLFPCLALAQYTGNAGQKISLGEQTTADGLVYRGVASIDTVTATSKITRANKQDTSAFLLLDTVTNLLWHYKTGSNGWIQAGGSTFDTTTLNLTTRFASKQNNITLTTTGTSGAATLVNSTLNIPQYSGGGGVIDGDKGDIDVTNSGATWTIDTSAISLSGNKVTGTLPVANGGTGQSTLTVNKVMVGNGTSGVLTPSRLQWNNTTFRLGIGQNPPTAKLHLTDTFGTNLTTGLQLDGLGSAANNVAPISFFTQSTNWGTQHTANIAAGIFDGADGGAYLRFSTQSGENASVTERLRITNLGNVGIGTTSPTEKLHVVGNARITAVGAGTFANNLNITSDGTLTTATSDEKYKYNILPITYGLNTILQLNPVNFQWIKGEENDLGFIAQDVAEIIPEAVNTNWNSDLLMRYESIIPILTKAIQEQQSLIKALEQRILILENK